MADGEEVTLDGRPLQALRVADLKAALEQRGLVKSGQKSTLIKRLRGVRGRARRGEEEETGPRVAHAHTETHPTSRSNGARGSADGVRGCRPQRACAAGGRRPLPPPSGRAGGPMHLLAPGRVLHAAMGVNSTSDPTGGGGHPFGGEQLPPPSH